LIWVFVRAARVCVFRIATPGEISQGGAVTRAAVGAEAGVINQAIVAGPAAVLMSVQVVAAGDEARIHLLALSPVARAIAEDVGVTHGGGTLGLYWPY